MLFHDFRCNYKVVQCSVLEAALRQHEDVLDCAAYAMKVPDFGEIPAAWVVLLKDTCSKNEVNVLIKKKIIIGKFVDLTSELS